MRSLRTTHITHDRSPLVAAKRAPALALGAFFLGAMFFGPAATAQTTTTAGGETSTTLAPTATTVLDATATDSSAVSEDTAVPAGGVDAGFGGMATDGGTKSDGGTSPIIPIAVGTILVGGFAVSRVAKGRRVK